MATEIRQWSINGVALGSASCADRYGSLKCAAQHNRINCMAITTSNLENVVATGHTNGEICIWNAFSLCLLATLQVHSHAPLGVTALTFTCVFLLILDSHFRRKDNAQLYSADAYGTITCWCHKTKQRFEVLSSFDFFVENFKPF